MPCSENPLKCIQIPVVENWSQRSEPSIGRFKEDEPALALAWLSERLVGFATALMTDA